MSLKTEKLDVIVQIRLSEEICEKVKVICKERGITFSQYVRECVYLLTNKKELNK